MLSSINDSHDVMDIFPLTHNFNGSYVWYYKQIEINIVMVKIYIWCIHFMGGMK